MNENYPCPPEDLEDGLPLFRQGHLSLAYALRDMLPGSAQGPLHPTTSPPIPTGPRMLLLPHHIHHRKAGSDPSVGVGGAWEAGGGLAPTLGDFTALTISPQS